MRRKYDIHDTGVSAITLDSLQPQTLMLYNLTKFYVMSRWLLDSSDADLSTCVFKLIAVILFQCHVLEIFFFCNLNNNQGKTKTTQRFLVSLSCGIIFCTKLMFLYYNYSPLHTGDTVRVIKSEISPWHNSDNSTLTKRHSQWVSLWIKAALCF